MATLAAHQPASARTCPHTRPPARTHAPAHRSTQFKAVCVICLDVLVSASTGPGPTQKSLQVAVTKHGTKYKRPYLSYFVKSLIFPQ